MYSIILIFALLLPPTQPTPRLIVLGDSVAHGAGASTPSRSWAALVAVGYGLPLINLAIDSTRVAEQPMPTVSPGDLVVWLVGYNDSRAATPLDAFRVTVQRGVAQLLAQGARVVLVGGLRMSKAGYEVNAPFWNHGSDTQAKAYADSVRDLAPFVDLGGFVPSMRADLVHPDDAGHARIAQAVLAPTLTASWQGNALHVTWVSPGWHTVWLDHTPLDQGFGIDSGIFDMAIGGVDHLYEPKAGRVLRLVDERGIAVASVVVPIHLVPRVWLPWVVNRAVPPPAPVWRVWLGAIRR